MGNSISARTRSRIDLLGYLRSRVKMDKKYLYNGRRVRLIQSTASDIGFDSQNPIVIYDRKIESEVGAGRQLTDGSYLGFIACGMHG